MGVEELMMVVARAVAVDVGIVIDCVRDELVDFGAVVVVAMHCCAQCVDCAEPLL